MFRFIMFALFIVSFSLQPHLSSAAGKLRVVTSIYPLAHFASEVGGEHAEVITLTPGGIDPHEYEPSVRDLMRIWDAGVFIFHGAGIDPWAERVRKDLGEKGVLTVYMSQELDLPGNGDESLSDSDDPHPWLDPLLARKEVQIIRDALVRADPVHAETYGKNSEAFTGRLLLLHRRYEDGLRDCEIRDIIIAHDSLRYLARRYSLQVLPITGISPGEEPSPRRMARIIRFARGKKIRYIFTEPLVSSRIAETIAREVGAATLPFHTFGGLTKDEMDMKRGYISVMDENLHNLRLALSCR
jgi:zinc transport system substrate-binding protein